MSNRSLKLKLWSEDNRCHWCKRCTHLTDIPRIKGHADPLMATIDHVVSRIYLSRWVKKKFGQKRKILSCYECNHARSVKETLSLSREELVKRSHGFSLNPRGKPRIIKPLPTIKQVKERLTALRCLTYVTDDD